MISDIKSLINKLYNNNIIRYVFFGALTTLVNLISYGILRNFMDFNIANIISIILAIIFAYYVNSRFVFRSKSNTPSERFSEFVKFISARITTMFIEVVGVYIFVEIIQIHDLLGKILIQFVILVLNYIFSKLLVFRNH